MGNDVADEGYYHDQEHIKESCPTEVPRLVPAAARGPTCNRCKGAQYRAWEPGRGLCPGVSMAVFRRLIWLWSAPAVTGRCMATGPGGSRRAVYPWRLSPGPRLGCGPDSCRRLA